MQKRQAEIEAFNRRLWEAIGEDADAVLDMASRDSGYVGEVSDFAVSLTEVKTRFTGTDPSEMIGHIFGDVDEESFVGHRGFSGDMD